MATVYLAQENEASGDVKAVFDEIKQRYGLDFVPNIWKAQAQDPSTLRQKWEAYKKAEDTWGKETINIIGLSTAIAMSSPYTIDFHTAMLKQLGYDDKRIEALVDHITTHIAGDSYTAGLQIEPDTMQGIMKKGMAA